MKHKQWRMGVGGVLLSILSVVGPALHHAPSVLCGAQEVEPNDDAYKAGGGCVLSDDLAGVLASAQDLDGFTVAMQGGLLYTVQVIPTDGVDVAVRIAGPGSGVLELDAQGPGGIEQGVFRLPPALDLPEPVAYSVGVRVGNTRASGAYILRVQVVQIADPPLPPTAVPPSATPVPTVVPSSTTPVPTATVYVPPPPPTWPAPTWPAPPPSAPAPTWPAPPAPPRSRASATPGASTLTWQYLGPVQTPPPSVHEIRVQVYSDQNGTQAFEPGEGVAGVSVRVVAQGAFVAWGLTDGDGRVTLRVVGDAERVAIPFLSWQTAVRAGVLTDVVLRVQGLIVPTFLPVEAR